MRHAKAQASSIDVVISIAAVLFFIALLIILFPMDRQSPPEWGGKIIDSIQSLNTRRADVAFMDGYRINEDRLTNLSNLALPNPEPAEKLILADTEYGEATSDICIFFVDSTITMQVGGEQGFGKVWSDAAHTSKIPCPTTNPCKHYDNTKVYTRPVERLGKIVNMHVVVCS